MPQKEVGKRSSITFFRVRDSFGRFLVTFSDASVTFFITFFAKLLLPDSFCSGVSTILATVEFEIDTQFSQKGLSQQRALSCCFSVHSFLVAQHCDPPYRALGYSYTYRIYVFQGIAGRVCCCWLSPFALPPKFMLGQSCLRALFAKPFAPPLTCDSIFWDLDLGSKFLRQDSEMTGTWSVSGRHALCYRAFPEGYLRTLRQTGPGPNFCSSSDRSRSQFLQCLSGLNMGFWQCPEMGPKQVTSVVRQRAC